MLDDKARAKITGAARGFMHACYAVQSHEDGTGTVVLEWYETSVGRDFCSYDVFMRTEIKAARKIVRLLNAIVPGGIDEAIEYPAISEDEP